MENDLLERLKAAEANDAIDASVIRDAIAEIERLQTQVGNLIAIRDSQNTQIGEMSAEITRLRGIVEDVKQIAESPILMNGWYPGYANEHGNVSAYRELARRVIEAALAARGK